MSYLINKSDGSLLTTIVDGTIDTSSSSLVLIGKNYAGYGEFLNDNLVRMLENFSNVFPPANPLDGQIWWNNSQKRMYIRDAAFTSGAISGWRSLITATSSGTRPDNAQSQTGDIWWDAVNQQLWVYNGTDWVLIGPAYTAGEGKSGIFPDVNLPGGQVYDKLMVNDVTVAILSNTPTPFTLQANIPGFNIINPGFTMAYSNGNHGLLGAAVTNSTIASGAPGEFASAYAPDIYNFFGTANNADFLGKVPFSRYVRTDIVNQTVSGNLTVGNLITTHLSSGSTGTAGTITGQWTLEAGSTLHATYADLAERFAADAIYPPGTVVMLGGAKEITAAVDDASEDVFGIISSHAAYLLNAGAGTNETHPPVAQVGRVPVRVIGKVKKGDRLVSAGNGLARSAKRSELTAFNVIGRSITEKLTDDEGVIEATVKLNS